MTSITHYAIMAFGAILSAAAPHCVHGQLSPSISLQRLQCLVRAYPQVLDSVDGRWLYWRDGTRMPLGTLNPSPLPTDAALDTASLLDQMAWCCPSTLPTLAAPPTNDVGRARSEEFFKKLYGSTAKCVQATLRPLKWLPTREGSTLMVSSLHGAFEAFERVSRELDRLPDSLLAYVRKPAGTFKWRVIAGTRRLSMHSFGIAIDINLERSHYWRYDKPDDTLEKPSPAQSAYRYRNQIPLEIVQIFERHGFLWGGRWYHYDTMHFEYRPELMNCSCEQ